MAYPRGKFRGRVDLRAHYLVILVVVATVGSIQLTMSMGSLLSYCVNVSMNVKPDRRDDFVQTIRKNQRMTLANELRAQEYVIGEDLENPGLFHLHERYLGKSGFDEHLKTQHFKDWEAFVATDPFTGPPSIGQFDEFGGGSPRKHVAGKAYCQSTVMHVKPDRRDDFLECIGFLREDTLKNELRSLMFQFGEEEDTKNLFFLQESYSGEDGYEAHKQSKHFAAWEKAVKSGGGMFVETPEVASFLEDGFGDKVAPNLPSFIPDLHEENSELLPVAA